MSFWLCVSLLPLFPVDGLSLSHVLLPNAHFTALPNPTSCLEIAVWLTLACLSPPGRSTRVREEEEKRLVRPGLAMLTVLHTPSTSFLLRPSGLVSTSPLLSYSLLSDLFTFLSFSRFSHFSPPRTLASNCPNPTNPPPCKGLLHELLNQA